MAVGTYSIKLTKAMKKVDMVVGGTFTPEQAIAFVEDYQSKLAGITANEFDLHFDCRGLDIITPEMTPSVVSCLDLYKATGFKKVIIGIKQGSPILKMQLNRLGRTAGLTNLEVNEIY